ncbi:hypothetical protein [Streptomyces sp. NBC_01304]|uniref:hypothetical protein n=1 Tax=Streptomyces sp. NBC_01304 TaxID=2903818 RepID=UPI002E10E4A9|nr:hypothetical protein OG430_05230 [Streptomyces sp. NBC_01304]
MDRVSLTAEYLDKLQKGNLKAGELLGALPENRILNSDKPGGKGQWLARPLFLGRAEQAQVAGDLETLLAALASLPDRLFGGDFEAFARAVGLNDIQVSAVLRSRSTPMTRQTRADLICDGTGFKLLELNMGSTIGGAENVDACRELLAHPALAEFADRHALGFMDSLRGMGHNILVESGFAPGDRPLVAMTDSPEHFAKELPYMTQLCARLRESGLRAHPCHLGQLALRDGRVWLDDAPVDIVMRTFAIGDVLNPQVRALLEPVLDAALRGEVKMFTPLDTSAYASKGALAMLSDENNREHFSAGERASLDRILPWTRMVRRGPVTLEGGERVDLVGHALAQQRQLVLKPTSLSGGKGVVLGWADGVTPERWREQIETAVDGPWVLQRRIHPALEEVPDDDGRLRQFRPVWGVLTGVDGFIGASVRAIPATVGDVVVNVSNGAHVGAVLHQTTKSGPA